VTAVLNKNTDGPTGFGEVASDRGLRQVTQKLLVALIENEVNSALIFVAVARAAYLATKFGDGNAALSKAEAICAQASELARDGCGDAHQMIADRLRELRLAIDATVAADVGKSRF
jgi:hypothetical protein